MYLGTAGGPEVGPYSPVIVPVPGIKKPPLVCAYKFGFGNPFKQDVWGPRSMRSSLNEWDKDSYEMPSPKKSTKKKLRKS